MRRDVGVGPGRRRVTGGAASAARRVPVAVWALTALFTLVLVAWTHLTPMAQAPDEASHVALVQHVADGHRYPEYDTFHPYDGVVAAWIAHGEPSARTPEAAQPRHRRPTLEGWGGRSRFEVANQISQHPPLYYWVAGTSLRAARALPGVETQPLDREWHLLRLGNVLLLAPLPLLAWATARRLGAGRTAATAAAVGPLAVPQLAHIGGSVNNDNLLILLSAVLSLGVAAVVRGDRRRATAVALGLVIAAALWTKAFALVALPWAGIAYAVASRRRGVRRQGLAALGLAGGVGVGLGCWPWVRNQLVHGEAFPSILDQAFRRRRPGVETSLPDHLATYLPSMTHRFWGSFGPFVAPLTPAVVGVATVVAVVLVVAAFAPLRGRARRSVAPLELAAFASIVPLLGLMLLLLDLDRYRLSGLHAFMQGRYLFGALVPLVVVGGLGAARLLPRCAPVALLGGALVLQADAGRVVLRDMWAEGDASLRRSLDALVAWSPWPRPALLVLGVALAGAWAGAAAALWRSRDRPREARPSPRPGAAPLAA